MLQEYLSLNPKAILAGPLEVAKLLKIQGVEEVQVVKPGQDYKLAGVDFHTVPAYFLEGNSHPKDRQWVGYVLQLNRASYYITGDTQPLPDMAALKVDVLFPLLYGCSGNLEQALKMAALCKPRLVVPVHTGGQEEVIKKYLAQLSKGVQGAYCKDAKLIAASEAGNK